MPASELLQALSSRHGAKEFALGVEVGPDALLACLRTLRDEYGYRFYIAASATDREEAFEVIHGLRNVDSAEEIFVKVALPRRSPEVESATALFSGAEWHEREVMDLFGVTFRSHPDPRRILLPDEYEGHPLRKDFAMDTPWGYRPPSPKEEA
jgi:NADH:ubiquinone oxidoreductase subunit C